MVLTFLAKSGKMPEAFRGVYILRKREKTSSEILVLVVVLVLECKGL